MVGVMYRMQLRNLLKDGRILVMIAVASFVMLYLPYEIMERLGDYEFGGIAFLDFYFIFYSIMASLLLAYAAIYTVFTREKANRSLYVLLATPIGIRNIWFGKTAALTTVCYGLSICLSMLFGGFILRSGTGNTLVGSTYAYVSLFAINPIIVFLVIGDIGIVTMLSRDEITLRYGMLACMFGLFFIKPTGLTLWPNLVIIQGLAIVALATIQFVALKLLKNERVVLSMD